MQNQQPKISLGIVFVNSEGSKDDSGEQAPREIPRHTKFSFPTSIVMADHESSDEESMSLESHSIDST